MALRIEDTIQSQYACAPHITRLVQGFWRMVDPAPDIERFYELCFDIDTAQGVALDIWGRILGMPRSMQAVTEVGVPYWGYYNKKAQVKEVRGFEQAPFFYGAQERHLELSDEAYRLMLKTKAMANISTGSLADLNRMLAALLPRAEVQIFRTAPMMLKIIATGDLTDYEQSLLTRGDLPPIPTGVGLEVEINGAKPMGFAGGNVVPFDQGPWYRKNSGLKDNQTQPAAATAVKKSKAKRRAANRKQASKE